MIHRPRRLRRSDALRSLVRETRLTRDDFVLPLFACPGDGVRREISSMPGVFNLSIDETTKEAAAAYETGVRSIILFGLPESKDELASGAYAEDGIVQRAIRAIRQFDAGCVDHGRYVFVRIHFAWSLRRRARSVKCLNDESLELLARTAVSQAAAGADLVAPSAMMDGQVGAIREALDESGFENVGIMSYAVKYASGLYGPFREAAQSAPEFGDRRAYQMDPPNAREAMREAEIDDAEGADILMVKPATIYLDVLRMVRDRFDLPMAAYHVSGEYALIKAAAQNGWIDEQRVMMETLTSIKRAGADIILTYYAREAIRALEQI